MASRCSGFGDFPSSHTEMQPYEASQYPLERYFQEGLSLLDPKVDRAHEVTTGKFLDHSKDIRGKMAALFKMNKDLQEKLTLLESKESESLLLVKAQLDSAHQEIDALRKEKESLRVESQETSKKTEERVSALYLEQIKALQEDLQRSDVTMKGLERKVEEKTDEIERLLREKEVYKEVMTQEKESAIQVVSRRCAADLDEAHRDNKMLRETIAKQKALIDETNLQMQDNEVIEECFGSVLAFLPNSICYGLVHRWIPPGILYPWIDQFSSFLKRRIGRPIDLSTNEGLQIDETKQLGEFVALTVPDVSKCSGQDKFAPIIQAFKTGLLDLIEKRNKRILKKPT
jgi:hypothetical protein